MGKGKDGSECYTRFNKGGSKYVVCEGVQEARKKKREANKSKPPPKKPSPKKATPPPPKKRSPKKPSPKKATPKKEDFKKLYNKVRQLLIKEKFPHARGIYKNKYVKQDVYYDKDKFKETMDKKIKDNKLIYDNVIFVNGKKTSAYDKNQYYYRGKIYTKLTDIS